MNETMKAIADVAVMQMKNTAERIGVKHMGPETVAAFRAALELAHQAPGDLMGEQREYMLPRIRLIAKFFMTRFPHQMSEAINGAVDGWGDPLREEQPAEAGETPCDLCNGTGFPGTTERSCPQCSEGGEG